MKHLVTAVFLFALAACDNSAIPPGQTPDTEPSASFQNTARVEKRDITRTHGAVGTIRPLTESRIESQVSGQVLTVMVSPGDTVKTGQILVTLDSRQLTARLDQAKEGLAYAGNALKQAQKARDEASAGLDQARAAYERSKVLFDKGVVPSQKLEIDRAAFLQAKARLERSNEGIQAARSQIRKASEVVKEADIGLEYASIRAPAPGVVVERLIDPGDLAVPGKPVLIIQTSGSLRLEARVREGLIHSIVQGQSYAVEIQTLGRSLSAVIEEIVPYADPQTRTFLVKAALPDTPGVYPGMFGRLLIPVARETALLIPEAAVIRVGQLEMVHVKTPDQGFHQVYIKTGKRFDPKIEVLSGLTGNETLGY